MNKETSKKYMGALFDLDGTLVDNYTAVHACLCATFSEFNLPKPTFEKVYRSVGGSILITIKRVMDGTLDDQLAENIGHRYMELFPQFTYVGLKLLPFAKEILKELSARGVKIACFTNKQQSAADDILKYLEIYNLFDVVSGTTLLSARKPEARYTLSTLEKLGLDASQCVGIGDSPFDYLAAKAVDMDSAIVATGADSAESLAQNCADIVGIYANMKELAKGVFGISLS